MRKIVFTLMLLATCGAATAQQPPQPDPAKLVPWLQQQRNAALDGAAQCYVTATDLQDQIAELKKDLAAAKSVPKKDPPKPDALALPRTP